MMELLNVRYAVADDIVESVFGFCISHSCCVEGAPSAWMHVTMSAEIVRPTLGLRYHCRHFDWVARGTIRTPIRGSYGS